MGSFDLLQNPNARAVLEAIREDGPVSRHDIATRLNLTRLTVSRLVEGLVQGGLVDVDREAFTGSSLGRKPTLFRLHQALGFIVGVEIYPDFVTALLTDVHFNVVKSVRKSIAPQERDRVSLIGHVKATLHELIERAGIDREAILGIGLACPGEHNCQEGKVCGCHILGADWHGVPICSLMADEFDLPVFLEHDVRAMAWAERKTGKARGVDDFIFISIGTGVGAGIFVGGQMLRGTAGRGGEFGHIVMDENGPRCGCGNLGCLEAFTSIPAVLAFTRNALERGTRSKISDLIEGDMARLSFDVICRAAEEDDRLAVSVVERVGEMMGRATAMLVTLFNPALVVFGKDAALAGDMLLNRVRHLVRTQSLVENTTCVRIENSSLGVKAGALGAAVVVHDRLCDLLVDEKAAFRQMA